MGSMVDKNGFVSELWGNFLQNNNPNVLRQAKLKRMLLETALEQMWRLDTEHFNNPHVILTEDWKKEEHGGVNWDKDRSMTESSYRK